MNRFGYFEVVEGPEPGWVRDREHRLIKLVGGAMPQQFEHNSSEDPDVTEYEELSNVISLDDCTFTNETFVDDELTILQPRLVALGFTEIAWHMGERDAFGPLSRTCHARDAAGELRFFIYG